MFLKKILNANCTYIVFFICVLFLNVFFNSELLANSLKISELEVSEPFNLKFSKQKVFDKAFKKAFQELSLMVTTSEDKKKINKISLSEIKSLIDSFDITNERFINDEYFATFNVNFNRKNTYTFFEKKNIFPSIPKKIDVLFIPILVDENLNQILMLDKNLIYTSWNKEKKNSLINYILPSEDLDDVKNLNANSKILEEYNFNEIVKKYDLSNYIISIVYQNRNSLKILSKVNLNNNFKVINSSFENIDFAEENSLKKFTDELKTIFEDSWKNLNKINTSIKLPLTVFLRSNDYKKIKLFEEAMNKLDLVSSFRIVHFNNSKINYKIIYNGTPSNFIIDAETQGITIEKNNQFWEVK